MKLTIECCLRRIINSSYHPFSVIPKPDVWPRRERVRRLTAWQYSGKRDSIKMADRRLNKVFHWMNMQRTDEFKYEKHYAQERVEIALAEHNFDYKNFRGMLDRANIILDNITLSQLAIYEPLTFKSLVVLTKQMAMEKGRPVIASEEQANVEVEESLFRKVLPKARLYEKGPAKNHNVKTFRRIKPSEM